MLEEHHQGNRDPPRPRLRAASTRPASETEGKQAAEAPTHGLLAGRLATEDTEQCEAPAGRPLSGCSLFPGTCLPGRHRGCPQTLVNPKTVKKRTKKFTRHSQTPMSGWSRRADPEALPVGGRRVRARPMPRLVMQQGNSTRCPAASQVSGP